MSSKKVNYPGDSAEGRPFVSVIVPTYKDWESLSRCLQALEQQIYPKERYEVIVVNNEADCEPPETVMAGAGNVVFLTEPTPGSYAARNTGVKAARGVIYAFTDSDCLPDCRWLENGVHFLLTHPDVGYLGGRVELSFEGPCQTLAETCEKAFAFRQDEIRTGRKYAVTANLMARREVFVTAGAFDPQQFSGGDWEWGNRAASKGYKIAYCEEARVTHPARRSLRDLLSKHLRVSGGQYRTAGAGWYRFMVMVVGFFPPVVPIWKLRDRTDLSSVDKAKAILVLYAIRILRSVSFIMIGLKMMKPKRQ